MSETGSNSNTRRVITKDQLITVGDLQAFKEELKSELLMAFKILLHDQPRTPAKKWLKSPAVEKLLDLAPNTLKTLRDNGTIPFTKLGGTYYYDADDIERELERRKGYGRFRDGQGVSND